MVRLKQTKAGCSLDLPPLPDNKKLSGRMEVKWLHKFKIMPKNVSLFFLHI